MKDLARTEAIITRSGFQKRLMNISAPGLFVIRDSRFANDEYTGPMILKPQDVVVALKLLGYPQKRPPISQIAVDLKMAASEVHAALKRGEAAHLLYDFIWHDLADKYIEETKDKNDQETKDTLMYLLINCLKLLHPFMPFITEEIYSKLPIKDKTLLLIEKWPH